MADLDKFVMSTDALTQQIYGQEVPWPHVLYMLGMAFIILSTLISLVRPDFLSVILSGLMIYYHASRDTTPLRLKQTALLVLVSDVVDLVWLF
jgi:hypothetical protein